jgi:hypothetical protein
MRALAIWGSFDIGKGRVWVRRWGRGCRRGDPKKKAAQLMVFLCIYNKICRKINLSMLATPSCHPRACSFPIHPPRTITTPSNQQLTIPLSRTSLMLLLPTHTSLAPCAQPSVSPSSSHPKLTPNPSSPGSVNSRVWPGMCLEFRMTIFTHKSRRIMWSHPSAKTLSATRSPIPTPVKSAL